MERREIFNNKGWDILFFNEIQVNDETVLTVLGE